MKRTYTISAHLEKRLDELPKIQDGLSEFASLRLSLVTIVALYDKVFAPDSQYDASVRQAVALNLVKEANAVLRRKKVVVDILCDLNDAISTLTYLRRAHEVAQQLSPELADAIVSHFPILHERKETPTLEQALS